MIKSMTGFGRASISLEDKLFSIEVRSLNSKQLDLSMRIPSLFREKESEIRSLVAGIAERGKVDFSISGESVQEMPAAAINTTLAKSYYKELKALAEALGIKDADLLPILMKMPDVLKPQKDTPVLSDATWKTMKAASELALAEFDSFRKKEGRALENELKKRIALVLSFLKKIELMDKKRYTSLSLKIKKSLKEHLGKEKIDQNRFEQELIYYFEKLDISEEKLRLKTHCDYFLATMKEGAAGRKLGFIAQEIGREINTIGSKANDAEIQKLVVQMKDELEKIKEQLMNVL